MQLRQASDTQPAAFIGLFYEKWFQCGLEEFVAQMIFDSKLLRGCVWWLKSHNFYVKKEKHFFPLNHKSSLRYWTEISQRRQIKTQEHKASRRRPHSLRLNLLTSSRRTTDQSPARVGKHELYGARRPGAASPDPWAPKVQIFHTITSRRPFVSAKRPPRRSKYSRGSAEVCKGEHLWEGFPDAVRHRATLPVK